MQAIEFEALVSGGQIKIPSYYKNLENTKAKVILLFPEESPVRNYNKSKLLSAFKQAHEHKVFQKANDSISWQKEVRDEQK